MEEEEDGREKTVVMWSGRLTRRQTVFPEQSQSESTRPERKTTLHSVSDAKKTKNKKHTTQATTTPLSTSIMKAFTFSKHFAITFTFINLTEKPESIWGELKSEKQPQQTNKSSKPLLPRKQCKQGSPLWSGRGHEASTSHWRGNNLELFPHRLNAYSSIDSLPMWSMLLHHFLKHTEKRTEKKIFWKTLPYSGLTTTTEIRFYSQV